MFHTKLVQTHRYYKLYELLQVSKDASGEDIKKAYKKAALRHHPDKGGDAETFRAILNAFNILSDPHQRRVYDESEERAYTTHIQREAVIKRNIREGRPLDKSKLRKEAVIQKSTRERRLLDQHLFGIFDYHFGTRSDQEDVYKGKRTKEDKDFEEEYRRIFFQHFPKA